MTGDERDESVRRAFQELREEDQRTLPPFDRRFPVPPVETEARAANHRSRWLVAAVVLVAAGVGLIALRNSAPRSATPNVVASSAALVAWASPTERLLQTTGRDLTGKLPRVGAFDLEKLGATVARTNEDLVAPLRR